MPKKTIEIIGIDKPFEDFRVFTSDGETFYISQETLMDELMMLPKKFTVQVETKRTRTWIVSSKEHEPVEKKVDRFTFVQTNGFEVTAKTRKSTKTRKSRNGRKGQS